MHGAPRPNPVAQPSQPAPIPQGQLSRMPLLPLSRPARSPALSHVSDEDATDDATAEMPWYYYWHLLPAMSFVP
ncbi:hypothetical protein FRB95_008324, partial [Tulasnella sp. JGI-2019a]